MSVCNGAAVIMRTHTLGDQAWIPARRGLGLGLQELAAARRSGSAVEPSRLSRHACHCLTCCGKPAVRAREVTIAAMSSIANELKDSQGQLHVG